MSCLQGRVLHVLMSELESVMSHICDLEHLQCGIAHLRHNVAHLRCCTSDSADYRSMLPRTRGLSRRFNEIKRSSYRSRRLGRAGSSSVTWYSSFAACVCLLDYG